MLREYKAVINGHETTIQLDEAGAEARGLTDRDLAEKAAPKPANKARGAANKSARKPADS